MNSSRLRKNPTHIFDCFLEIAYPQDSFVSNPARGFLILQTFPASFKSQAPDWLRKVPEFVFPCSQLHISTVQNFSFVLTNAQSQWTFGFCRVAPGADTALVMISSLQWHEIFYRLLNRAAEIVLRSRDDGELWRFLEAIYNARVPDYTAPLHISWQGSESLADLSFTIPSKFGLPAIPENRNLTEYYNACGVEIMYGVFAAMLKERRIIITSNKLPKLSACVQAANTLLFPMHWQHIFIPILPKTMIEYVEAPMPFLIGVPAPLMKDLMASSQSEIVIVDADSGKIKNPFDDVGSLPMEITNNFNRCLRNRHEHGGDAIPRAFLQALVHLIGGYRDALKQRPDEPISFDGKVFVTTRNQSLQPFLEEMLDLQIFRQFIEERIETLSRGKSLSDEFEREVMRFSEKDSSSHSGARIVKKQFENIKKEGGAIFGIVKEKSNPVMKSVRETGKQAIRDIKHKSKSIKSRGNHKQQRSISPSSFSVGPTDDLPQLSSESPSFLGNRRTLSVSNMNTGGSSQDRNTETGDSSRNSSSSGLSRYNTDFGFVGRVLKYERFDPPPVGSLVSTDLPSFKVDAVNNPSPTLVLQNNFTIGALERSPEMEAPAKLNLDLMKDLQDFMYFNPPPAINRDLKPVAQNSRMLLSPDIQNSAGEIEIAAGGSVRNIVDGPHPPPRPKLERTFKSKPEPPPIQDLIALGDSVDDDFFDPLMTSKKASNFSASSNLLQQTQAALPRPPTANVASITQFYENQQKSIQLGGNNPFCSSGVPFHESNGGVLTNGRSNEDQLKSFQASLHTKSSEDLLQEYGLNFGMLNVNAKPSFSSSLSPTVASPMSLSNEKIVDIFDPIQINSNQPGVQHTPLTRSRVSTATMNFSQLASGGPVAPPRAKKPSTEGWTKFD